MAYKDPEGARLYREANKERIAAKKKAHREANKEKITAKAKAYREANKDAVRARKAADYVANKEARKQTMYEYYERNKEHRKNQMRAHYALNAEKYVAEKRDYRINNKDEVKRSRVVYAASNKGKATKNTGHAKRRAAKIERNPTWLSETDKWMISEIYLLSALRTELTGVEWHVDHTLPLQGKLVSGLHVPYNLRVITAKENILKGNRVVL